MVKGKTIDHFRRAAAQKLRVNVTGSEAVLWRHLRRMATQGPHFRRQVPVGPYVADFACMAARLLIELDGSWHGDAAHMARDEIRTRWLENEGYRVIRFWNNDLTENLDGVLDTIHAALYGSRDTDAVMLKHTRRRHSTPARKARRLSPSRGG